MTSNREASFGAFPAAHSQPHSKSTPIRPMRPGKCTECAPPRMSQSSRNAFAFTHDARSSCQSTQRHRPASMPLYEGRTHNRSDRCLGHAVARVSPPLHPRNHEVPALHDSSVLSHSLGSQRPLAPGLAVLGFRYLSASKLEQLYDQRLDADHQPRHAYLTGIEQSVITARP